MAHDAILPLIRQTRDIPRDRHEVDFLIVSNGVDPAVALRIIDILRERLERIFA
jgi:hypothetical protein